MGIKVWTAEDELKARKTALSEQQDLGKFLAGEKKKKNEEQAKVLDALRRSRRSRGGVGAPLEVPANLAGAAKGMGIIVTDADLDPNKDIIADLFKDKPVYGEG